MNACFGRTPSLPWRPLYTLAIPPVPAVQPRVACLPSETLALCPATDRPRPKARVPELGPIRAKCARKLPQALRDGCTGSGRSTSASSLPVDLFCRPLISMYRTAYICAARWSRADARSWPIGRPSFSRARAPTTCSRSGSARDPHREQPRGVRGDRAHAAARHGRRRAQGQCAGRAGDLARRGGPQQGAPPARAERPPRLRARGRARIRV